MSYRGIWLFGIAWCVLALTGTDAGAANLYRWIDKDGKVQYSQTPPVETPTTETKISVPDTKNSANVSELPPYDRDAKGNCATIKCMADQMEADRLERERGYARQREANERATAKAKPAGGSATATSGTPMDEQLRNQCRRGVYYGTNSRINCDDPDALRQEYSKWQRQNQQGYERYRDLQLRYPDLYR